MDSQQFDNLFTWFHSTCINMGGQGANWRDIRDELNNFLKTAIQRKATPAQIAQLYWAANFYDDAGRYAARAQLWAAKIAGHAPKPVKITLPVTATPNLDELQAMLTAEQFAECFKQAWADVQTVKHVTAENFVHLLAGRTLQLATLADYIYQEAF